MPGAEACGKSDSIKRRGVCASVASDSTEGFNSSLMAAGGPYCIRTGDETFRSLSSERSVNVASRYVPPPQIAGSDRESHGDSYAWTAERTTEIFVLCGETRSHSLV